MSDAPTTGAKVSPEPKRQSATPTSSPRHIAIIMDGNRRWARARSMPPIYGHQRGAEAVRRVVEGCGDRGIRYLTLYAFSSENWRRPHNEVGELMNLLRFYLQKEIRSLHKNGIRLQVIGSREGLDADICALIDKAEKLTEANQRLTLVVALNYGGRDEIVTMTRKLAAAAARGELDPEDIDAAMIDDSLYTAGIPDPDLLIRTSGEQRISNFLLWQLAYTELVFLDVSWPDFTHEHLDEALAEYGRRDRRYGACAG